MINVVLAYDDNDDELADYFTESYNNINGIITTLNFISSIPIRGLDCTESNLITITNGLNDNPFIFIGLSHGREEGDCLLTINETFVSHNNIKHFQNSFFYSTACDAAKILGPTLLTENCFCFIGCNDASWVSYEDFHPVYIACENFAICRFLQKDITIQQSFEDMKAYFDDQIQDMYQKNEILVAIELENNRDMMVLIGDGSLTRKHFHKS